MSVRSGLSLFTRISVAVLVSLTLITAAVTTFVVIHSTPADAPLDASADVAVTAPSVGSAARYLEHYLSTAEPTGKSVPWQERGLSDLLPNHLFSVDGAEPTALAAGIVVGDVSAVTGETAVSASDGATVAFDADNVSSRTLVADISIRQGFGEASGLASIRVALSLGGDVDPALAVKGLGDLGTVIVVLDAPGAEGMAPDTYAVRHDFALLGFVDGSGTVRFPALGDREAAFLGALTTVDAITSASLDSVDTGTIENGVIK